MRDETSQALRARLNDTQPFVLLDVREPFERELAKIPTSSPCVDVFIPMRELSARIGTLRAKTAAANVPIIVYCHHGVRSLMVAEWLGIQGFENVRNLAGGIDDYSLHADPSVPRY